MTDLVEDPLLRSLTPAQCRAVQHVDGALLILAGPGSGKTRVVTHRIAYLLREGVPAHQILALTFTNKAATEMKERVKRLAPGQGVWISTFHRLCARLLRQYASLVGLEENYAIYDTSDSQAVLKKAIEALQFDPGRYTPQQIAGQISWAKNNLVTARQYLPRPGRPLDAIVAEVYPAYQSRLLKSNAVDFDDLLLYVAMLLKENPEIRASLDHRYRYILVDEYQDTNLAQYAIIRALSLDYPNLSVTGDPDQSIYGWRGANLSNILEFENDYPQVNVVRLEQNYRSTKSILRAAANLIAHNRRRKEKGLFTENVEGEPVRLVAYADQQDEAMGIATRIAQEVRSGNRRPRDFAVFYRVNALSRAMEFALRDCGVPYQVVGGQEFFQRKEIKDILSYLALLNNPRDDVSLLRVINTPPRGIGKTTIDRLLQHAERHGLTLLEAARQSGLIESVPKRSAVQVARFVSMFDAFCLLAARPVEEILGHVMAESGYQQLLKESTREEDAERLANIEELLTVARQFDERYPDEGHLEEFLEEICLVNETDNWEEAEDRVTLMTLHASKGLEFPVVFVIAAEEGLIPHERCKDLPEQMEEERRLLFVGITRAERQLQLSRAIWREFRGQRNMTVPSSFLFELPLEEFDTSQHEALSNAAIGRPDAYQPDPWDEAEPSWAKAASPGADARVEQTAGRSRLVRASLTTAAELAAGVAKQPKVSAEVFHQGMVVRHPEYGLGKIVALSGSGARRTATVAFAAEGQKKFVLEQSPLRPVK